MRVHVIFLRFKTQIVLYILLKTDINAEEFFEERVLPVLKKAKHLGKLQAQLMDPQLFKLVNFFVVRKQTY